MKHLKLTPLLIAAAFSAPRAHAVELIAVGSLSGLASDLSTATAGPLQNGAAGNLLAGMGMICLVGRRKRNEVFRQEV